LISIDIIHYSTDASQGRRTGYAEGYSRMPTQHFFVVSQKKGPRLHIITLRPKARGYNHDIIHLASRAETKPAHQLGTRHQLQQTRQSKYPARS
jgi:hypothetical protein